MALTVRWRIARLRGDLTGDEVQVLLGCRMPAAGEEGEFGLDLLLEDQLKFVHLGNSRSLRTSFATNDHLADRDDLTDRDRPPSAAKRHEFLPLVKAEQGKLILQEQRQRERKVERPETDDRSHAQDSRNAKRLRRENPGQPHKGGIENGELNRPSHGPLPIRRRERDDYLVWPLLHRDPIPADVRVAAAQGSELVRSGQVRGTFHRAAT